MRPWIVNTCGSRPDLWTAMERWGRGRLAGPRLRLEPHPGVTETFHGGLGEHPNAAAVKAHPKPEASFVG
jgi:hypothetical protein